MDSLPFNKIIVDSRHASVGTSTNFEITLPETMSLPANAACYVTDVVISNSFSTLGTASGTINHTFYFIERIGNLTALNRVYLDETKMYEGNKLAAEIQTKMNAGSLGGTGGIYTVTYDFDLGTMVFSRTVNGDDSFILVNDDLLADPQFQTLLPFKTGANQVDWAPQFHNPSSAMAYLGLGKRSSQNINFAGLTNMLALPSLLFLDHSGAIDVRRTSAIYLHSSSLTNFRVLGPAGSRSILAKIPVNQHHGGVLVHQHSGHILDYIPCGGVTFQQLQFDLRDDNNRPVDLRGGHVSFTLLFHPSPLA